MGLLRSYGIPQWWVEYDRPKWRAFIPIIVPKEKQSFFSFLERGNWLIFQDVFPQFLLYHESSKRNRTYFHLLPHLNISIFMESVWKQFWKDRNRAFLAIAMIINEQNYLEQRVIKNPLYQKVPMNTLEFKLQDFLSLNHILFPYWTNGILRITGQTLHRFDSLHERILLGKRLYAVLFKNNEVLAGAEKWADNHVHTGSRKDYWPEIFNNIQEEPPGKSYQLRLKFCKLKSGVNRIYSPNLESAWKNLRHTAAEKGDWFKDFKVFEYFTDLDKTIDGEIENEYCKTLERIELAALAKKIISILD